MNTQYKRRFRSKRHSPVQQEPRKRKPRDKRSRFSLLKTILMIIGLLTIFVLLMRYVIIPVLVMLPQWLGGAA
ncbi:MAG: hypothetical protein E7316_00330 [Clostridiales bacterium]|nr:hypothetical protein [Clostridiales bacterium]